MTTVIVTRRGPRQSPAARLPREIEEYAVRLQEAVHLVSRLNAEQFARLKHRQFSGPDTLGSERLKGKASHARSQASR
jgi:hypothetical protein